MHDEEARRRAREAVASAFDRTHREPPLRRCPSCAHTARTLAPECPGCGKRYDRRLPWLSDRARRAVVVGGLLLLAGGTAYGVPRLNESRAAQSAREKRHQDELRRRETIRLTRLQRPVRGGAAVRDHPEAPREQRLQARRQLVTEMEREILLDARARTSTGEITGSPPREVICGALMRGSVGGRPIDVGDHDDLGLRRGRYDCTAVQRDVMRSGKLVARFGVPFVGTIDFRRGSWTFCQDVKVPGERGEPLAKVPIPRACLGAEGAPRVGDGYATPPS